MPSLNDVMKDYAEKMGDVIIEEESDPDAIFNDEEMVKIWLAKLLSKHNVRFTINLTIDQINEEIEDIKGTISNERLWSHADPIHLGNISTLSKYLDILNELLEERKTFEQNKQNGGNEEC